MKYRFSFTAANAMIPEFSELAQKVYSGDIADTMDASVLNKGKGSTNQREFRELLLRVNKLTKEQIRVLSDGDFEEKRHITHLALCKTYSIYSDFITEVIYQKVLLYDYSLNELDYNSFVSKKSVEHPELDQLAESTQKKVRQVIYRMLDQVGIIESASNPIILLQNLTPQTEHAIIEDHPKWLNCFFINENHVTEHYDR